MALPDASTALVASDPRRKVRRFTGRSVVVTLLTQIAARTQIAAVATLRVPMSNAPNPSNSPAAVDRAAPLPNFLIIGAQKSATRWLRSNLAQHPEIYAAPTELSYFNNAERMADL